MNDPTGNNPSAPVNVTSSAVSANSVLLSWNPPPASDSSCPPTIYILKDTATNLFLDQVVINTSNSTTISKTVTGLTQGLEYSFVMAGVDAGGRVGENSAPSYIVLDSEYKQTFRLYQPLNKNIPEHYFILPTYIHIAPQAVIGLKYSITQESITVFWMVCICSKFTFDNDCRPQ